MDTNYETRINGVVDCLDDRLSELELEAKNAEPVQKKEFDEEAARIIAYGESIRRGLFQPSDAEEDLGSRCFKP